MNQTQIISDLAKRELNQIKKAKDVTKALRLAKRVKTMSPKTAKTQLMLINFKKEFHILKKDPIIKRALIIKSLT